MRNSIVAVSLIAITLVTMGCASSGDKTAVTIYDSTGKVVQESSKDAIAMNQFVQVAKDCEAAKISQRSNLGIQAGDLSKLSPSAQATYMEQLPMMVMADALKSATQKADTSCQQSIVAYYNHKNVEKEQNASLWRKGLGILGFVGGAYVIGNSVEGILQSAVGASGTTNTISGSRVTQDSGNNYSSPGGNANASASGDGLGTNNLFPRGNTDSVIYGGNQPRGTATDFNDNPGNLDLGSNSGDNAEQILIPIEEVAPIE